MLVYASHHPYLDITRAFTQEEHLLCRSCVGFSSLLPLPYLAIVIDTLMIHGEPPLMRSTSQFPRSVGCMHGQIQQLYKQKLFFHMDMKNYAQSGGVLGVSISIIGSTIPGQTVILHCQIKLASRFEDTKRKQSDAACSSGITNFLPPHLGVIEPMLLWANCTDCLDQTRSALLKNGFARLSLQLQVFSLDIEAQGANPEP